MSARQSLATAPSTEAPAATLLSPPPAADVRAPAGSPADAPTADDEARPGAEWASGSVVGSRRRAIAAWVGAGLACLGAIVAFLTIGVRGDWGFVLALRAGKVAGMIVVGVAVSVATTVFQAITANRILTPSIMGFDALYLLVQMSTVFVFGAGAFALADVRVLFAVQCALMVGMIALLARWLVSERRRDLHLLVMVGLVVGVVLRSLTSLMGRLIDPNDYAVVQDRMLATFTAADPVLLPAAAILVALGTGIAWRRRRVLDVVALGPEIATVLGVNHRREVTGMLMVVALLTAAATALVGPVTFLGLLAVTLAVALGRTSSHRVVLPLSALVAVVTLVGGQAVVEHLAQFDTALAIVVEFAGGVVFLSLVLRRRHG